MIYKLEEERWGMVHNLSYRPTDQGIVRGYMTRQIDLTEAQLLRLESDKQSDQSNSQT
jgi:hypothetical protein